MTAVDRQDINWRPALRQAGRGRHDEADVVDRRRRLAIISEAQTF